MAVTVGEREELISRMLIWNGRGTLLGALYLLQLILVLTKFLYSNE